MNNKIILSLIFIFVVIIIGVVGIYFWQTSTKPTNNQGKDQQLKFGILETKILQNLTPQTSKGDSIVIDKRISAGSALGSECRNISHLEERADYIIEAGVSNIDVNQTANTKTISLGIVAWLKGNKNTNSLQILTSTAEHGESPTFEENRIYRIYLWELNDKLYFVCEFAGVIDLGYKDWYCHETDDGRNYLQKGTATVFSNGQVYGPYTDSCGSDLILDEVVCDNNRKYILSELYLCKNGCNEGACRESGAGGNTCSQQNGQICASDEICNGEWLNATDTTRCCSFNCETTELYNCEKIIDNGPSSDKVDIYFISEKYSNNNDFKEDLDFIIDWNNNPDSRGISGLFSIRPFNNLKNRFNIWALFSDKVDLGCAEYLSASTPLPVLGIKCRAAYFNQIIEKSCNQKFNVGKDKTVFLLLNAGKTTALRDEGFLALSINREKILYARQALPHEFGHLLNLADEYLYTFLPITVRDVNLSVSPNIDGRGCPKWCSGELNTLAACYPYYRGWEECVQNIAELPEQHEAEWNSCWSIWNGKSVNEIGKGLENCNLGIRCLEETGCFFGANNVLGWRQIENGIMKGNEPQKYGPYSEQYISNLITSQTK